MVVFVIILSFIFKIIFLAMKYASTLIYLINEQDGIGKQGGNFLNHKKQIS